MNDDIKKIKLIISDLDGVWTDGTFYQGDDGIDIVANRIQQALN